MQKVDHLVSLMIISNPSADNPALDVIMSKKTCLIILPGDFNTQTHNWYRPGKITYDGFKIDGIT